MGFFRNTEEFKACLSINASFNYEDLNVYIREVDRTILRKHLGAIFLSEIQTAFDGTAPLGAKVQQLVELIRLCSAPFAIIRWIPAGQLSIDDSGIRIISTDTHKQAFQWQIRNLVGSLNEAGTNALEDLLEFLERNLADFPTYKNSDEFKANRELFVPSASEFQKYYSPLTNCRVNFSRFRSIIRKVEDFEVKAVLLPGLFNSLKSVLKSGEDLDGNQSALMELIRPAVVNLTIARAVNELSAELNPEGFLVFDNTTVRDTIEGKKQSDQATLNRIAQAAEMDGRAYLDQLKSLLESKKILYPLYASDPLYQDPASFNIRNQDSGSGIYNAL